MYEKEISNIITAIKKRRTQLGYSQMYVAQKLDITQNVYSKIEANKIKLTVCRLTSLCEILEINIPELMRSKS